MKRKLCCAIFLVLLGCLSACDKNEDAVAAAHSISATSEALGDFYRAIGNSVSDTVALSELDTSIRGVAFVDADRKVIQETQMEIVHRAEMAKSLQQLAAAMTALTGSHASADIESAAAGLGKQLVLIKALPSGSPVPDGIGKAGAMLMTLAQQHQERKAAQVMDDTLAAVSELFSKEKPAYDSLERDRLNLAKSVATVLISREAVDPTSLLSPALHPFRLAPVPVDTGMQATLRVLAKARLTQTADELSRREVTAADGMLLALQQMRARIHLLATGKPMRSRGDPVSLQDVQIWLKSIGGEV